MKKNLTTLLIVLISILIATVSWDYISIPYNMDKQIIGENYLANLHNPLNDTVRFLIFLIIPFVSLISYFQIKEKKFFLI